MKKLAYYFSAALLGATVLFSSCKKKDDEPTPSNGGKTYTSVITTANTGTSGTANVDAVVSTTDGNANIRLEVSGNNNLDFIYVMLSRDNGPFEPVIFSTTTNSAGQTFDGDDEDYSLKIPNLSSFTVDLPVTIRTAGVTDVYQVWITNGSGDFTKPTKNRDLGIATITLKYTEGASATFTEFSGTVGDQLAVEPSFIVTTGQGGVMGQADYKNDADPENALSVDISFASLNAGDNGLGSVANLVSPSVREAVGFSASNEPDAANTNVTYFGSWSGTAFADVTSADLASIGSLSATTIDITNNGTYAFVTEEGKKGLIKVDGNITTSGTSGKKFSFTIKVLN